MNQRQKLNPEKRPKNTDKCTTDIGTRCELRVAEDLYTHGFEVHKNMSTRGVDFSAWKGRKGWRIEVRAAYKNPVSGHIRLMNKQHDNADTIALVAGSTIRYIDPATRKTITLDELTAL